MIDLHTISPTGFCFLFVVGYLVTVVIMFLIMRSMFKSALKAYTDALHEQYRRALDDFKRRHRIG